MPPILIITLKNPLSAATPRGLKSHKKNNSCTPCVPMFNHVDAHFEVFFECTAMRSNQDFSER